MTDIQLYRQNSTFVFAAMDLVILIGTMSIDGLYVACLCPTAKHLQTGTFNYTQITKLMLEIS